MVPAPLPTFEWAGMSLDGQIFCPVRLPYPGALCAVTATVVHS